MENIISFIKSQKVKNDENITATNDSLNQCAYQIGEIENMVIELSKNIDTTYEIFSPNAFDKDNNIVEIEKLNFKKSELNTEIKCLKEKLKELEKSKVKIDEALDEIYEIENQLANNVKNTKYIIKKEVKKIKDDYSKITTDILEQQIGKDNNYLSSTVKKNIDIIQNKFRLCENLIDIDTNRAKLEIVRLKEELNIIEKRISAKMFHVKHLGEDAGLYKAISDFVKEYQKLINMKIDFSYSGMKIVEKKDNIINVIRIIKETIDNANYHSNGNIININVIIDKLESNIDNNAENENNDVHQINFIAANENIYNVNIIITDNGDGFTVQEDKVLCANNLNGISIMKFRAELLNGTLNIESSPGLGTTVKLVYISSN